MEKMGLCMVLQMKEMVIRNNSLFVGNVFVHHAEARRDGFHALAYHTYLITNGTYQNDAAVVISTVICLGACLDYCRLKLGSKGCKRVTCEVKIGNRKNCNA